jgi:hypothetical protein
MVRLHSPVISAVMADSGKTITLVLDAATAFKGGFVQQNFVSFREFYKEMQFVEDLSMSPKEMEDMMMKAYMMQSFFAKGSQITSCFGLLVLKTLQTHQFTYQGERIIGWAIQDGDLKLDHERITKLATVTMEKKDLQSLLPAVITALRTESNKLPAQVTQVQMKRTATHVWLTFVVESGRIYDLDLSTFQFGQMLLEECITPVILGDSTAFHGICDRDRLLGVNMPYFETDLHALMQVQADNLRMMPGRQSNFNANVMKTAYEDMIDNRLLPYVADNMANSADPAKLFWNTIENIQVVNK